MNWFELVLAHPDVSLHLFSLSKSLIVYWKYIGCISFVSFILGTLYFCYKGFFKICYFFSLRWVHRKATDICILILKSATLCLLFLTTCPYILLRFLYKFASREHFVRVESHSIFSVLSLSVMFLRLIRDAACVSKLFLLTAEWYFIIWMYHFLSIHQW